MATGYLYDDDGSMVGSRVIDGHSIKECDMLIPKLNLKKPTPSSRKHLGKPL
jgi:hypothetical protein